MNTEKCLTLTIPGQIKSGKNNMMVARTGHHYPKPEWASWRDGIVCLLRGQRRGIQFDAPCAIEVNYWSGDLRRRDVAGMSDAICHCLERSDIVADDSLLTDWIWRHMGIDRNRPRAEITISQKPMEAKQ